MNLVNDDSKCKEGISGDLKDLWWTLNDFEEFLGYNWRKFGGIFGRILGVHFLRNL